MRAGPVVFVALLAIVAVSAADVESAADPAPKADAPVEKPKTFKPHMHAKGELYRGHVAPYPGGYDAKAWRSPQWLHGGVAPTTEQLLKRFPGADTRVPVRVPSAERSPRGSYDWETPEYEFEYAARTGENVRGRRRARRAAAARQNLPVVHYPRRRTALPKGARRARTPRPEGAQRKPKAVAKKGAVAKPQAKAKAAAKKSAAQRLDRLEKVMTFALRQLKRNLKRSKRLEKFAVKSKRAITLIAKALSGDEKADKLTAAHVEVLRAATLKTATQLENLHSRTKLLAAVAKKHKRVIATVAQEVVKTQKQQNNVIDNVNALRSTAKAVEKSLKNLDTRHRASAAALAAHAQKIANAEKNVAAAQEQSKRTQFNVKALHKAAVNAQKAILNVDARLVKSTALQQKEKKALKLAFGAIKQLAAKKAAAKKL